MRVWIINHYALPPTSAGGTRHYYLAKQLIERGHEVLVIAANYDHFSHAYIKSPAKMGEIDHSYDVPFMWIPTPAYTGNSFSRLWNMLVFSFRIRQKKYLPQTIPPDVIIGSSPHLFAALSAQQLAKKLAIPFLLEIRDIWPDSLVDLGVSNKHPMIRLMKKIELHLYKRAHAVISLLPAAKNYLVKCGVADEKILWLPNAIDPNIIPSDLRQKVKDKFTIMYAGAHGLANDLDVILDAAKILQQDGLGEHLRIAIVGNGPEKNRLKKRVLEEDIHLIEFFDPVAKNAIYHVLNDADVFLMLLKDSPVFRWGISPNKLFDYLLMARPIVFGVNTPFNPIQKYDAGITIKPSDPQSLAAAIFKLYSLPQSELAAMGKRGKDFVLNYHNVNILSASLEKLLVDVSD